MPSVVNISTSKEVKLRRHPFMDDPLFRRFFGDQLDGETQRASSLGSGVIVGSEGTFGIATKAWVRISRNPEAYRTLLGVTLGAIPVTLSPKHREIGLITSKSSGAAVILLAI
jgi:FAD/FMN-containing dehydrogenase